MVPTAREMVSTAQEFFKASVTEDPKTSPYFLVRKIFIQEFNLDKQSILSFRSKCRATVEGLHVTFFLTWVNHLELAMDDIRVLITAHEIRAMENEANLTSKKISKLPGRTITPANGIPTKLPSRPVVNPLATSMTADNRSTNILARPIQPLEEASVVLSQQRLKRARNGFERDTTTLASVLNMSDQGTAMPKSAHKFQVEILSDD